MKKLIGVFGVLFFALTFFFTTSSTKAGSKDFDLASVINTQTANAECETGGLPNKCCPYWNVTITYTFMGPQASCSTGGDFKCEDC